MRIGGECNALFDTIHIHPLMPNTPTYLLRNVTPKNSLPVVKSAQHIHIEREQLVR
jgi:hypothetical protein